MSLFLKEQNGRIFLRIYVQPKSSQEAVAGHHGDALKIKIKAPPVDGEANAAGIRFLASLLGLPRAQLAIKNGHKSRLKLIEIKGISIEKVKQVLAV